jgi:hypothetical protein
MNVMQLLVSYVMDCQPALHDTLTAMTGAIRLTCAGGK